MKSTLLSELLHISHYLLIIYKYYFMPIFMIIIDIDNYYYYMTKEALSITPVKFCCHMLWLLLYLLIWLSILI